LRDIEPSRPANTTTTSIAATQNSVHEAVTSHFSLASNISGSETLSENAIEQAA
jgi:hypothetical protein